MRSLEEVLTELYKQEINCSIHSEWDAGWTIRLGDPMNGYKEERYVDGHEVHLIAPHLITMVLEHHKGIELFDIDYKANVERWK